jgi:DNA-binding GntR family transcriptional regulator
MVYGMQPQAGAQRLVASSPMSMQAIDLIVGEIAAGNFKPNQRLVESELAGRYGTSRVPVREALRTLETQGIVVSVPHRGSHVRAFDNRQIRQVSEARYALELIATREAMRRLAADPPLHRLFAPPMAAMRQAARSGDRLGINRADIAFHRVVCQLSENEVVGKLWEGLSRHVLITFGLMAERYPNAELIIRQHEDFLAYLLTGDLDALPVQLARHVGGLLDSAPDAVRLQSRDAEHRRPA